MLFVLVTFSVGPPTFVTVNGESFVVSAFGMLMLNATGDVAMAGGCKPTAIGRCRSGKLGSLGVSTNSPKCADPSDK